MDDHFVFGANTTINKSTRPNFDEDRCTQQQDRFSAEVIDFIKKRKKNSEVGRRKMFS
jgi:hypothetical protein